VTLSGAEAVQERPLLSRESKTRLSDCGVVHEVGIDHRGSVLDGGSRSPMGMGNFEGGKGRPIVKYRDTLQSSVQKWLNQSRCRLGCGLGWAQGIMCKIGIQIPRGKGQFLEKGAPIYSIGTCRVLCKNG